MMIFMVVVVWVRKQKGPRAITAPDPSYSVCCFFNLFGNPQSRPDSFDTARDYCEDPRDSFSRCRCALHLGFPDHLFSRYIHSNRSSSQGSHHCLKGLMGSCGDKLLFPFFTLPLELTHRAVFQFKIIPYPQINWLKERT